MRYFLTNIEVDQSKLKKFPLRLFKKEINGFFFYSDTSDLLLENDHFAAVSEGYLRDLELKDADARTHSMNAINQILQQWPLPETITGSFSTVVLDKEKKELVLSTDLVNLYPLYYLKNEIAFIISNSIILSGMVSGNELDEVGILQRSIGHDFSNIGSRTIIKGCKRILPGEQIRFNSEGDKLERNYDNRLYQGMQDNYQKANVHTYWDDFRKEMNLCLIDHQKVNIALSGGVDSRVALGAIPEEKEIRCLTFGAKQNYETKIAARLAKIKGGKFENFFQPELYFPSSDILREYTRKSEAVQICSWIEIIENVKPSIKEPLILGELCEALPGRNILQFSSRKFRQKNFFKHYVLQKDYHFEASTSDNFREWKGNIIKEYLKYYAEVRLKRTKASINATEVREAVKQDLEEIFSRIKDHNLPYKELYDELFSWYTFTRMRLAKQLQISNTKFDAFSPAMSLQILRNTSNIHPNQRLNYRFARKLFKYEKDLSKFNDIPTSQAPYIPQDSPDFLKFPIWGLRSKADSYLIKRMMRKKDPGLRYRLFKSINWAQVYQNPEMERNLKEYFSPNHLGIGLVKFLISQCTQRKRLNQWPFANIEVINAAGLNMEINEIEKIKDFQEGE